MFHFSVSNEVLKRFAAIVLCPIAAILSGCSASEDPKLVSQRNQVLLRTEPPGAISLTEAKQKLESEGPVVLVGKVGSGSLPPFETGKAVFVISEAPADHGDNPMHNASECPFCKRRAAEAPIATVELLDANGTTFKFGADKLVGIQAGQTVVVQGNGIFVPDTDTIQIKSQGIFIRK